MDLDNLNIRKKEPVTNMSGTPGQMTKDLEQELYPGVSNFIGNDDINIKYQKGMFSVVEYRKDLSVTPGEAQLQYFMSKMNIKKKQLVIKIDENHSVTLQAGAMQWMLGNVNTTTGIKGAGDLLGKMVKGKVTGERAVKPEYVGNGLQTAMLKVLNDYVKSIGKLHMFTKAHSDNIYSIRNILKDGYKVVDNYENERGAIIAFVK